MPVDYIYLISAQNLCHCHFHNPSVPWSSYLSNHIDVVVTSLAWCPYQVAKSCIGTQSSIHYDMTDINLSLRIKESGLFNDDFTSDFIVLNHMMINELEITWKEVVRPVLRY
jgi:hypothetical protein